MPKSYGVLGHSRDKDSLSWPSEVVDTRRGTSATAGSGTNTRFQCVVVLPFMAYGRHAIAILRQRLEESQVVQHWRPKLMHEAGR
jgi:hypothetical protein